MDVHRVEASPVGDLVPRIVESDSRFGESCDHWAFVPQALLEELVMASATVDAVADAALALGRLERSIGAPDTS